MAERAGACTGAEDCTAAVHIHGCYADRGACDSPDEHARPFREKSLDVCAALHALDGKGCSGHDH